MIRLEGAIHTPINRLGWFSLILRFLLHSFLSFHIEFNLNDNREQPNRIVEVNYDFVPINFCIVDDILLLTIYCLLLH